MRILIFAKHSRLLRFADVVRFLAETGHEVVIAQAQEDDDLDDSPQPPKQFADLRNVRVRSYRSSVEPQLAYALDLLRSTRNYLWFFSEPQSASGFHRVRYARRLSKLMSHIAPAYATETNASTGRREPWPDPIAHVRSETIVRVQAGLAALEAAIPADRSVVEAIRAEQPDAVLVTPLMLFAAPQTDVVKAARELGVPCGFLVYSWDNLTNKGVLQVMPDRLFVWNEIQRTEAIEIHGVAPEDVVATGAPRLDGFFQMQPTHTREDFCAEYGLDPDKPIILYVASSGTVSSDEPKITERWIEAVRSAPDARVCDANILVRTYPASGGRRSWQDWQPSMTRIGVDHCLERGYQGLFDDIHHAAVVVGLNTSAQIEAAALEKPVYAFAGGDDAPGQEQTLNFSYMLQEHGGNVEFASTLDEHVRQLASGISGDYDREAIRRFAQSFLRPHGLDKPVAPILAGEILSLAGERSRGTLRKSVRFARSMLARPRPFGAPRSSRPDASSVGF